MEDQQEILCFGPSFNKKKVLLVLLVFQAVPAARIEWLTIGGTHILTRRRNQGRRTLVRRLTFY